MLLLSPAGHSHYLVLLLPLIMGLLAAGWERGPAPLRDGWITALLFLNPLATLLPILPGLGFLHDTGIAVYVALLLWTTAVVLLWRQPAVIQLSTTSMPVPLSQKSAA
jgi:hypothetical protein